MAMGKPTETRQIKNSNKDSVMWITNIEREETAAVNWKSRWGWMASEIADMQDKLQEVTKRSKFLSNVNKNVKSPDLRSIKPIPPNTNGEYGWISNKEEFKLEVWGPDVFKAKPLPEDLILHTKLFEQA